jgi:hypothetical protein
VREPSHPERSAASFTHVLVEQHPDQQGERRHAVQLSSGCTTSSPVSRTIGFRPTEDDERIIREAMRDDERTADVIRRALRLLDREAWLARARADAERLVDEDLSDEADAW